jgi:hypothetical protein
LILTFSTITKSFKIEYYGRKHSLVDSTIVASKLANSVGLADNVELEFRTKGDYSELKKAFP